MRDVNGPASDSECPDSRRGNLGDDDIWLEEFNDRLTWDGNAFTVEDVVGLYQHLSRPRIRLTKSSMTLRIRKYVL